MEIPDDKGFVHVDWPSKNIPHGGVFHSKVVKPTPEQHGFLKVLLEESKLTLAQRRKGAYLLRQHDEPVPTRETPAVSMVRPRTSRRRSLSAIRESGIYNDDNYRPVKRGQDREKLKENLVHRMAYGEEQQQQRTMPAPPPGQKQQIRLPTKKEQWNDLVTQIRERADWLADMENLGQGAQYRDLVNGQIAERMRALDALGIDSQCSTPRSTVSSLSQPSEISLRSKCSANSREPKTNSNSKRQPSNRKPRWREENVSDYENLTPLQFSPRRRV